MKLTKLIRAASAAALVGVIAAPAQAALVVLDGWQLFTPGGNAVTGIGRLNLVSGSATVEQEVSGGSVFVGADFRESGSIFSISYTKENVVGAGDIGAPTSLTEQLTIAFSGVAGKVTALNPGGGFKYSFTGGSYTIAGTFGTYASGSLVGIGGNASSTAIIGGFNGDSTALGNILSSVLGFDMRDNTGASLLADLASGAVFFEAVTNNNLTNLIGGLHECTFEAGSTCQSFSVASAGDAYLTRQVPEPGSVALVGLALFGAVAATRRKGKKA